MSDKPTDVTGPLKVTDLVKCAKCGIEHKAVFVDTNRNQCWPCSVDKGHAVILTDNEIYSAFRYFYPQFLFIHINNNIPQGTTHIHAFKETDEGHEVGYCEACMHKRDGKYLDVASDAKIYRPDFIISDHAILSFIKTYANAYLLALKEERMHDASDMRNAANKLASLAGTIKFEARRYENMRVADYFKIKKWYTFIGDYNTEAGGSASATIDVQANSRRAAVLALYRTFKYTANHTKYTDKTINAFLAGQTPLVLIDSRTEEQCEWVINEVIAIGGRYEEESEETSEG